MDQTSVDFDQTDEDILTYTVSDEAIEAAAADIEGMGLFISNPYAPGSYGCNC